MPDFCVRHITSKISQFIILYYNICKVYMGSAQCHPNIKHTPRKNAYIQEKSPIFGQL